MLDSATLSWQEAGLAGASHSRVISWLRSTDADRTLQPPCSLELPFRPKSPRCLGPDFIFPTPNKDVKVASASLGPACYNMGSMGSTQLLALLELNPGTGHFNHFSAEWS